MLGLETLACVHDIPVIRSSTDKLLDVYAKAKKATPLIGVPCNLAESVADKSLQIALNVVNPVVKPFSGPVRALDNYAVEKLRDIETKYPVINTRPEDVVNTLNEKTECVRNAINSVRDTTTSTLQHGKETVTSAASDVADSVYSFCASQKNNHNLSGRILSTACAWLNRIYQGAQLSLLWFRVLSAFVLLKVKQINDAILTNIQSKSYKPVLPLRLMILISQLLDYAAEHISPNEKATAELKRPKQQSRYNQQQYYLNHQNSNSNSSTTTRQRYTASQDETAGTSNSNGHQTQSDRTDLSDDEELDACLGNSGLTESTYNIKTETFNTDSFDVNADD